jgi:uncharacterized membrane protein YciS (DUF1049 family)
MAGAGNRANGADGWWERLNPNLIFLCVTSLWIATPFLLYVFIPSLERQGQFGDSYGFLNTLFSGLAFAGLICALTYQKHELRLQRQELKRATDQYERSALALESAQKEAVKARSVTVFLEIMSIMQDLRPEWHQVYALPDDYRTWTSSDRELADKVSAALQRVAYLTFSGFIDPDYVIEGWHAPFINCWQKLGPFIKAYRVDCGEPAELVEGRIQQRRHFEQFVELCRAKTFGKFDPEIFKRDMQ